MGFDKHQLAVIDCSYLFEKLRSHPDITEGLSSAGEELINQLDLNKPETQFLFSVGVAKYRLVKQLAEQTSWSQAEKWVNQQPFFTEPVDNQRIVAELRQEMLQAVQPILHRNDKAVDQIVTLINSKGTNE